MTIFDAIRITDMLKPNRFTKEQKIGWLNDIDQQIYYDIVATHENPMRIQKPFYDINSDPDTHLIAPAPYDEVYTMYLQCQIDLGNMEITKYNNDRTRYNNALLSLRDYWNRTFMPCDRVKCFMYDDRRRHHRRPYDGRPLHSRENALNMPVHMNGPMTLPHTHRPDPLTCEPHMPGIHNIPDDEQRR